MPRSSWVQIDLNPCSATSGIVMGGVDVTEDGAVVPGLNGFTVYDWNFIPT